VGVYDDRIFKRGDELRSYNKYIIVLLLMFTFLIISRNRYKSNGNTLL